MSHLFSLYKNIMYTIIKYTLLTASYISDKDSEKKKEEKDSWQNRNPFLAKR